MPRVAQTQMAHFVILALLWCIAVVDARRIVEGTAVNQTLETEVVGCSDYCIQCNDGSTVWYGRSRSWFRAFVNVFTEGLLVPLVAIGNMVQTNSEESSTHWTGYLPTTGVFCEKVDIIKYPHDQPVNHYLPLMLADNNWFGRVSLNLLKPYNSYNQPLHDFQPQDYFAYKKGCKTVKASGWRGSAKQFKSIFENLCESRVTEGIFQCSTHSRICGQAGVRGLLAASTPHQCQASKNTPQHSRCPVPQVMTPIKPGYQADVVQPPMGHRSMEVRAPQGTFPGQQIAVIAPDSNVQLMVTIPPGVTGGQVFTVTY